MTISVLDRRDEAADHQWLEPSLGGLHDVALGIAERASVRIPALPCHGNDPELWFAELPTDVELAKALCEDCPVRSMCLAGALERREPWGVWGGELFLQGTVVPRKRPRGRPRKDAAAQYALELGTMPASQTAACDHTGADATGRDDDGVAA